MMILFDKCLSFLCETSFSTTLLICTILNTTEAERQNHGYFDTSFGIVIE